MSSPNTFSIAPIQRRLETLVPRLEEGSVWVDPFARNSAFKDRCTFTNDLNREFDCTHHLDARASLKSLADGSVDGVLLDPPYSPRQIKEVYGHVGLPVTREETQASFYASLKREIARITHSGSTVVCFGWNSGGVGHKYGFDITEILLVPHGGAKHDTIMTVCVKR